MLTRPRAPVFSSDAFIASNRKARYDYFIEDEYEAGMVLKGTEVKSLRLGKANIKDSYARVNKAGEIFLHNAHFSPYDTPHEAYVTFMNVVDDLARRVRADT